MAQTRCEGKTGYEMRRSWIALLLLAACAGAAGLAMLGLAEGWWRPANPDRARGIGTAVDLNAFHADDLARLDAL